MKPIFWASSARISVACISVACSQVVAAGPDPADAAAAIPPTIYKSPFVDYRALGEDKNTPWKDANETVGKIGGWRAYAREAADAMKARETAGAVKPVPGANAPSMPTPPAPALQPHKHGG
ncbi:MAG: hypothetical protein LH481_09370 [Burkholderiales bacterium]|nr:hypothetical protein [Burkholderiales bacterium]